MIWFFFVPFSFLEVVPSGITQEYFHLAPSLQVKTIIKCTFPRFMPSIMLELSKTTW